MTSKLGTKIVVIRCVCYAQNVPKNAFVAWATPWTPLGTLYAPHTASWIWGKQRGGEEKEGQRMEGEERAEEGKGP